MIANYHTHTWRCNHAEGTEEEYIRQALHRGLKSLGFSDHTPYFFPGNYYSHFRMRPHQLDGYVHTLKGLQKEYSGQIDVSIGLEAEYYPKYFPELLSFLKDYPIDYMILGQHFVGNEPDAVYSGKPFSDVAILHAYCHQVMDAMQTGLFTYVAHPDIIHFEGADSVYTDCLRPLIQEAASCGIPLEINHLGIRERRHYPANRFWQLVGEENCPVIMGLDAHSPEAISETGAEKAALELVDHYGLTLFDSVALRKIH